MVEKALDEVLRKTFHNGQSGVGSVVYNVVEQIMLDLLFKDVIGECFDAHIAKAVDMDEAAEGFWSRLLSSSSLMAPIATFIRQKTDMGYRGEEMQYYCSAKGAVQYYTYGHQWWGISAEQVRLRNGGNTLLEGV